MHFLVLTHKYRQVTAEPSWAKGLESESGPGKQRITFKARTAVGLNNSAECSFTLEVRGCNLFRSHSSIQPNH